MLLARQGRGLFGFLPVLFGIGALACLTPRFEPPAGIIIGLAVGAALLPVVAMRAAPAGRRCALGALALLLGYGDAAWQAARQAPMPALPHRAAVVTGRVAALEERPPRADGGESGKRLVLTGATFDTAVDFGMRPLRRSLRITLRPGDPAAATLAPGALSPGATVSVRALLRPPEPPSRPGGRDFQREAWFSGLAGSGYALGPVRVIAAPPAGLSGLEALRESVARVLEAALPGQTGAIAATLLAGETGAIDAATRQDFAASGLAHLLAVAGLHLGIVTGFVMVSVRAILASSEWIALRWPCKEIAAGAALLAGTGYVVLTGAHLPSLRALGMAALVTLALMTGRRVLSMRSLALAALLLLAVSPVLVFDVSFQMSFAAVMALIAGYDALRGPLSRLRGDGGPWRVAASHLAALTLTSALAGVATLPVSIAHFGALQPWFVIANLVAVPLAAFWVMPCGLVALALMPLHLAGLSLAAMGAGIGVIRRLAHLVAALPAARLAVSATPGWGLLVLFLGLCWLCLWRGRARLAGIALIVAGAASPRLVVPPDVLVSPDAGLVAVRSGGALLAGPHSGLERLVLQDWEQALALPLGALPEECAQGSCRVTVAGRVVLLRLKDGSDGRDPPDPSLCAGAALFVSASPARGACPGVPVIDRFSVWRDGAYAVTFGADGARVVSDRSVRGARLWVPPPGFRGVPNLPLAKAE